MENNTVGVFNDKQGAMIILIHQEEFLKLIKACNGVRFVCPDESISNRSGTNKYRCRYR